MDRRSAEEFVQACPVLREGGGPSLDENPVDRILRPDAPPFQFIEQPFDRPGADKGLLIVFIGKEADLMADPRESQVGIPLTQGDPVFGTGGEHPVRLGHPLGHEVVDHHPDERFPTREEERGFPFDAAGGVDPGDDPLSRRLFIAGRPVHLTGEEEATDPIYFK